MRRRWRVQPASVNTPHVLKPARESATVMLAVPTPSKRKTVQILVKRGKDLPTPTSRADSDQPFSLPTALAPENQQARHPPTILKADSSFNVGEPC
jgi:hypothetical protein